jgi:hypothetical protein
MLVRVVPGCSQLPIEALDSTFGDAPQPDRVYSTVYGLHSIAFVVAPPARFWTRPRAGIKSPVEVEIALSSDAAAAGRVTG